jgi:glycerol-3-phosphate acyltransferase PlsY
MDIVYTALLAIAAFLLGSIPFSVIIGRWLLKKDITTYGDHNPGAANVFRAGSKKVGFFAVVLDILKGIPCVFIAHYVLKLPVLAPVIIAVSAVLGHAFSPFLHWRGGKAIAVTFGTTLGLMPQYEVFMIFAIAMILCAFLIRNDSWGVMIASAASLTYFAATKGYSWEPLLMLCFLIILGIKHFEDLHSVPHLGGRFLKRSHAR